MKRLSDKEFWDCAYISCNNTTIIKKHVKLLCNEKIDILRNYSEHLLWNVLLTKYLPKRTDFKVVEIGSAPGNNLIKMKKIFGYIPYGIEYTQKGSEINRKLFQKNNINPENIINADFLSEEIINKYANYFDVVFSFGFIEHFDNPKIIFEKHVSLLKNNGYLVIVVPNLTGINKLLVYLFCGEIMKMHNIEIMHINNILEIVRNMKLISIYCNYYGIFNFGLFKTQNFFRKIILNICNIIQIFMNVLFRYLLKYNFKESKYCSPYILFIGKKY